MASHPPARTYLDAGGRAPLHPVAREALLAALAEGWADPHRLHTEGRRARLLLDGARESLAAALGARTEELLLAPSHTAALYTGLRAARAARARAGSTVVLSAVERAALLQAAGDDARELVGVDRRGRVDVEAMARAVRAPGVALAALQHANGEVGTVQPVEEVHAACRDAGVPLLVDAGASVGHAEVPAAWDLLAADPLDWGAPAGIGLLGVRARVRLRPPAPPEEDERGMFPGGASVPVALAAAAALRAVLAQRAEADRRRRALVDRMRERIPHAVPDVEVVGDADARLPHVLTFSCLFVDGEALVAELDRRGFAVGSGSACTSSTLEPSHVLAAMGVLTHGNVRLALPTTVTEDEVDRFLAELPDAVETVRAALGVQSL